MNIDELIQLIRLCNMAQVRAALESMVPAERLLIQHLFERAFRQPK